MGCIIYYNYLYYNRIKLYIDYTYLISGIVIIIILDTIINNYYHYPRDKYRIDNYILRRCDRPLMMELNNGGFLSGFTVHFMAHEKIFSRVHDPSIFSAVSTIKQTHQMCISWTPNQPVEKKPNGTCSSGFPMTLSINTSSSRQLCCHGDEKMWQLLRRGAIAGFALLKIIGIGHWVSISYRLWILSITEKIIVSSQNFESTLTLQLLLYNGFKLSPWTRTKRSKNDMYVYVIYEIYIVYHMLSCVLYIYII